MTINPILRSLPGWLPSGGLAKSVTCARLLLLSVPILAVGFLVEIWSLEASLVDRALYALLGLVLIFGSFCHLLLHLGYVSRRKEADREALSPGDMIRGRATRSGYLIPSYREEPDYVFRAMLSAALQRNENKWIRLLIDDSPTPISAEEKRLSQAAHTLPSRLLIFLAPFQELVRGAAWAARREPNPADVLIRLHNDLSEAFRKAGGDWPEATADDRFFRNRVLFELAHLHSAEAKAFTESLISPDRAFTELEALGRRFDVSVESFQRKRFENLSHAANKAMNLNVAIDLIGKHLVESTSDRGCLLVESPSGEQIFPSVEFVVTLDADSLLSPTYAETLLGRASRCDMKRAAVVQTPYAATTEPSGLLERTAGATTDVQRILHQGFSRYDSGFWVGANAVLRLAALRDIAIEDEERGWRISRFIQDRTPIEDTESTIDLALKGWRVVNHDDVLAWSATPPDFGSLAIQRRRWACGGLLVLHKACRATFTELDTEIRGLTRLAQLITRVHYLGSLFWVPLSLVLISFNPLDDDLASVFLALAAVPYFIAYAMDLHLARRPIWEIVPVHVLNVALVPVNLAGAFASIRQVATGRKVPFTRTPKVGGRTAAPAGTICLVWGAGLVFATSSVVHLAIADYRDAAFAGATAVLIMVSAALFVGWRESVEDVMAAEWISRWTKRRQALKNQSFKSDGLPMISAPILQRQLDGHP